MVNAPTYALDKALALLFKRHVPRSPHSIQNSLQLKSELDKLHIPDDYKLVSFDVVSLFTNISFDLIIFAKKRKWKFLKSFLPLKRQEFLNGIILLLNSAYFQFNNQFYKQILGDPMVFCTSPWFAEIILEYLEIKCLNRLKSSVMFYKRYVDDSFSIIKSNKIEHALSVFN